MAPTLSSSLVISITAFLGKTFLSLLTRSVRIEGLPILLEALREPDSAPSRKGKERAGFPVEDGKVRRGIVTGEHDGRLGESSFADWFWGRKVCNHSSVLDDPTVCQIPSMR